MIDQERAVSPWQNRGSNLDFHDSKDTPIFFSPYGSIKWLLGHLYPLPLGCQYRQKGETSGTNEVQRLHQREIPKQWQAAKEKKIRQYWGGHTDSEVCSEKKQPNYYYHLGNSLSISPVILDPDLLHRTPQTENNLVTKFSFPKALWDDFALCLLWLSQTKSYFLQWWWWKVNLPWTPHTPELGFNMAKLMCEPVLLFNVVSIKVFIKPGAAAGPH